MTIQFLEDFKKLRKEFTDKAKEAFKELVKTTFDSNPGLTCISWVQYSPSFNDGNPCVFGVHEPWFWANTTPEEAEEFTVYEETYDGDNDDVYMFDNYGPKKNPPTESMLEFAHFIQDNEVSNVMEDMFGYARVNIYRKGDQIEITSSEYCDY